jgi:hypothetical protein
MSHISRVKTQMAHRPYIKAALLDLGYRVQEDLAVTWIEAGQTRTHTVPLAAFTGPNETGLISFCSSGPIYEVVADWQEISIAKDDFLLNLTQRYAYHACRAELETQGFAVKSETTDKGSIRLVLTRHVLRDRTIETHEVESCIDHRGEVSLAVRGMPGATCLSATNVLEQALGGHVTEREMTAEALFFRTREPEALSIESRRR